MKATTTIPGISDHEIIVVDSDVKPPFVKKKSRKVYKYKKADWDKIRAETAAFAEEFIRDLDEHSVEENWLQIKDHLKRMMNEHIPSKFTTTRFDLPWVDNCLKRMCRRKQRL